MQRERGAISKLSFRVDLRAGGPIACLISTRIGNVMSVVSKSPDAADHQAACQKCAKPLDPADPVCRSCGYYALLDRFVEVDEMDKYYANGEYHVPTPETSENPYMAAMKATPGWVWSLGCLLFLQTGAVVLFHFLAPMGTALRLLGGVGLALLGVAALGVGHLLAGLRIARDECEIGPLDILTSPLRIWHLVGQRLPKMFKRTAMTANGLWAIVLAHAIIGVPYWQFIGGEPPKKKKSLLADVVSSMSAAAEESKMSLEDAMKQLAGEGQEAKKKAEKEAVAMTLQEAMRKVWEEAVKATDSLRSATDPNKPEDVHRLKLRALTIGYNVDEEGRVNSLIVAINSDGKWKLAGEMACQLTPEQSQTFIERVASATQKKPYLRNPFSATWIEPNFFCNVECDYSQRKKTFSNLQLLKLN